MVTHNRLPPSPLYRHRHTGLSLLLCEERHSRAVSGVVVACDKAPLKSKQRLSWVCLSLPPDFPDPPPQTPFVLLECLSGGAGLCGLKGVTGLVGAAPQLRDKRNLEVSLLVTE